MHLDPVARAKSLAAALERNADALHRDRVDWDTFRARNRALWRQAEADPSVTAMVLGLLRHDPNWKELGP